MTFLVKNKPGIIVPAAVQREVGIKPGDWVEFCAARGSITIRTTAQLDEKRLPFYTPTKAEKQAIARGLAEYKRGEYITLKALHDELDAARHKVRKKSGTVKCTVLPAGVDDSLVFARLGQFHIKGKKDWAPYEEAGFLYRRFKNHNVSAKILSAELGLSTKKGIT